MTPADTPHQLVPMVTIVGAALVFQLAAAVFAFRLIRITTHWKAWICLVIVCSIQAFRRIVVLAGILSTGSTSHVSVGDQIIGLAISVFMLSGMALVSPIFHSLNRADQQIRAALKEKEAAVDNLSDALAKVKVLSGLIPICASCKRIRDDKGYWKQVERYIREHADVQFTHGLCPECSEKLIEEAKRDASMGRKGG